MKPLPRPLLRVAGNAMSVLTSDVLNRATTLVLYVMVARYLDQRAFGQLSLALALFYTFQVFATLGLPTPITREVARHKPRTPFYLAGGSALAVCGSAASCGALALFVLAMGYAADTTSVILLLSLGLAPYALSSVCEAVLRGQERMHLIACANVPVNLAKIGLAYWMLEQGYGLHAMVVLLLGCRVAIVLIEWALLLPALADLGVGLVIPRGLRDQAHTKGPWRVLKPVLLRRLLRNTTTFLGIDGLLAIRSSMLVVLISKLTVDAEVNIAAFNAAAQLLVPFTMFNQSITISVFPLLCRQFNVGGSQDDLRRAAGRLIEVLLAVVVPGVLALVCLADSALVFVYGSQQFAQGAAILRIMAATVVCGALTSALGQVLLAGLREKTALRIVAVNVVAQVLLGIVLISAWGVVGAAVAALLTRFLNLLLHYARAVQVLEGLSLGRLAWKSVVAGLAMSAVVMPLKTYGLLITVAAGAAAYAVVLIGLIACTSSVSQLRGSLYRHGHARLVK